MKREHYSDAQLVRFSIRDLINDYRSTHSDFASGEMVKYHDTRAMVALCDYAYMCKQRALNLFRNRHGAKVDRFGQVTA